MGISFFKYVEKVINALPKTINTIKDTQGFVNAVNSWEDGECKQESACRQRDCLISEKAKKKNF